MRVDSWIWSMAADFPGADSDDTHLPLARVWWKTHEATVWFSQAQINGLVGIYRDQGIEFAAWCVPLGYVDDVANAVAVLDMMRAAGIERPWLQFNFESEPTPNFWKGTPDQVWNIYTEVDRRCPWAQLSMALYQYEPSLGFVNTGAHPAMRMFTTEDYWTSFGTTPEARLAYSYLHLAPYAKPIQYGIPGNSSPADMQRGLAWLADHAGLGVPPIVWRRGTTSRATWDVIDAFVLPEPKPAPAPEEPTIEQVKYGLVDKIVRDQWDALAADVAKIRGAA